MSAQNHSARSKKITEWLKYESVANDPAMGSSEIQNGSKNLAIFYGRVREDVEKKMRAKKNDK